MTLAYNGSKAFLLPESLVIEQGDTKWLKIASTNMTLVNIIFPDNPQKYRSMCSASGLSYLKQCRNQATMPSVGTDAAAGLFGDEESQASKKKRSRLSPPVEKKSCPLSIDVNGTAVRVQPFRVNGKEDVVVELTELSIQAVFDAIRAGGMDKESSKRMYTKSGKFAKEQLADEEAHGKEQVAQQEALETAAGSAG